MYYYIAALVALYYLYPSKSYKVLPEVIIGPGGVLGFYSLGICHYLVNHFELRDKHIAGFSSGAFNTLFMRVKPKKRTHSLRHIFGCKETSSMLLLNELMEYVEKKTTLSDYNLSKTSIGISHLDGISLYDTFHSIEQVVRCCKSSSFVPYVTNETGVNYYNDKISMDGYFLYGYFMQHYTTPPLVITPGMFGRFKNPWLANIMFVFGVHPLQDTSIYQMYLNGYHDAVCNHRYFEAYLKPIRPRNPPYEAPLEPQEPPAPQTAPGSCSGSIPVLSSSHTLPLSVSRDKDFHNTVPE
jgi:hypothetical protein